MTDLDDNVEFALTVVREISKRQGFLDIVARIDAFTGGCPDCGHADAHYFDIAVGDDKLGCQRLQCNCKRTPDGTWNHQRRPD
jgi:hypothetical protein